MQVRIEVTLSPAELSVLTRPVDGSGGFQDLLRGLQAAVRNNTLTLTVSQVHRIVRYVNQYGQGGFQERLGIVLDAIRKVKQATQQAD